MSDILFRGKRKDTGEWVYGRGIFVDNATPGDPVHVYSDGYFRWREVIPETVGQFTGLLDKNDVKIFEGDIVLDPSDNPCVVMFIDGAFEFEYPNRNFTEAVNEFEVEIIGNIHDNPKFWEEAQ